MEADGSVRPVPKVAVIVHAGKTFGGGLPEPRRELQRRGVEDPFWREVPKSKKIDVKLDRKVLYEVDGGDRVKVKAFKIKAEAKAVTVCVPRQR